MRRFWKSVFDGQIADRSVNLFRQEIQGFVELGMKRDALRLVRGALKSERVSAEVFNTALDAIFAQADRRKAWTRLIESGYGRLSTRDQRSVRFGMLAFYCGIQNYESASRFVLRRFGCRFGLVDLAFAMETWLALGRMDKARSLVRRCVEGIESAEEPEMQAMLIHGLAKYFAKAGESDAALHS